MKKIIAAIFLIILSTYTVSADTENVSVILNGEKILFDNQPVIIDDRTLVPFRKIFEILDYTVEWNDSEKSVTASNGTQTMKLEIGSNQILINNESISSDAIPRLINSATYVPIRIISEYSGCDVLWHSETQTVLLYTKQEPYKSCHQGSFSIISTDGKYIYWRDENSAFRFKEDLSRENLPFGLGNDISINGNKLYGRAIDGLLHYFSVDLDTFEVSDLSKEDVAGCVIYNNQIYYGFLNAPITETNQKTGIHRMNLDGSGKEQVYDYKLYDYFIKDDLIFSQNKIISLNDKTEKYISGGFITATALDDENYYIAISEYTDEKTPLKPIGVNVYNYKTGCEKIFPYDKIIEDIEVTDNSIFITHENSVDNYSIVRMTKNFEYPVEIKSNTWNTINIFGNYIYYSEKVTGDRLSDFSRLSTDGKEYINLEKFWSLTEQNKTDKNYKTIKITYNYPESADSSQYLSLLEKRLLNAGYTDTVIIPISGKSFAVYIRLADDIDYTSFANKIVSPGVLTFQDVDKTVILDNTDIITASALTEKLSNEQEENFVKLELTDIGRKKFYYATEKASSASEENNYINIVMDDSIISAPIVSEPIDSNTIVITGNFTEESADSLANIINSSVLPFKATVSDITALN